MITFAVEASNIQPIHHGYAHALEGAGLSSDTSLVVSVSSFDMASGAEGARKLLFLPQPPTAIFAISDTLALGAMSTIKQAGLRIPDDIALVGFNNIPLAALVEPGLTTVAAPAVDLGRAAMGMLRDMIARVGPANRQIVLPTNLVVRQSCGC